MFLENDKSKHLMSHYDSLAIINILEERNFFRRKAVDDMDSLIFLSLKS